jgi:hypothetical protein
MVMVSLPRKTLQPSAQLPAKVHTRVPELTHSSCAATCTTRQPLSLQPTISNFADTEFLRLRPSLRPCSVVDGEKHTRILRHECTVMHGHVGLLTGCCQGGSINVQDVVTETLLLIDVLYVSTGGSCCLPRDTRGSCTPNPICSSTLAQAFTGPPCLLRTIKARLYAMIEDYQI